MKKLAKKMTERYLRAEASYTLGCIADSELVDRGHHAHGGGAPLASRAHPIPRRQPQASHFGCGNLEHVVRGPNG